MIKRLSPIQPIIERINESLTKVYQEKDAIQLTQKIIELIKDDVATTNMEHENKWSEKDILLITYGDSIKKEGELPFSTLHSFLKSELQDTISCVHILPFFPYTSDDGFSVSDYTKVNPALGSWDEVSEIAKDFDLMADLVINHVSSESEWFKNFKQNREPGAKYFISLPEKTDVSQVVRPRSHPLLTRVMTSTGEKHVWATFSEDQIDLNFANPDVLLEIVKIVYLYLKQGVRFFRLDAIGFLWKELGTNCMHLPQTHEIIKLLRIIVESIEPSAVIVTETNVPNIENLSYYGRQRNEAHIIYNFSLPPLILDALLRGRSEHLRHWMMSMPPAPFGCTYLNFTASHDGIGLRPAEGLLSEQELEKMIEVIRRFGGEVSMRKMPDGSEKPYELNISLFDAMQGTINGPDGWQLQRFLCSQIIMMSLDGIPAFYIHSLLATPNDRRAFENEGRARLINRHKWDFDELTQRLNDSNSNQSQILQRLRELIGIRRNQEAFHPNATQYTLHLGKNYFGFWRQSMKRDQSIFVICNLTNQTRMLPLTRINLVITDSWKDLIRGSMVHDIHDSIHFEPYQCIWLSNKY